MVETTSASLTIVDGHTQAPKVYWMGRVVSDVLSIAISNRLGQHNRVVLRVKDPEMVTPTLTVEEISSLVQRREEMETSGIRVLLG